jgi:hypothetical protein
LLERDINKLIPHEFVVFALSKNKSPSDVTLRSAEWAVITQIDGHKSLKEIADILALSNDEAINLFVGLNEKGLIEVLSTDKREEKIVPKSFFEILQEELMKIIGPVAPFLIEDALLVMDIEKKNYKVDRVPELIEAISDEITDDMKRVKFQQAMLNHIKGLKTN